MKPTVWRNERPVSVKANVREAHVKRAVASGRSQNGQAVEYGQPLVVIG